jgi:hypothetical protein
MTIFVNIMLILLAFAIVSLMVFKYIYPLFFINKWDRIIVQRKKHFNEIIEEFSSVTKEKFKEEKSKLRKEKLNKLNKL